MPLKVTVHLEDVDVADLYFYAVPDLADAIQGEMSKRLK